MTSSVAPPAAPARTAASGSRSPRRPSSGRGRFAPLLGAGARGRPSSPSARPGDADALAGRRGRGAARDGDDGDAPLGVGAGLPGGVGGALGLLEAGACSGSQGGAARAAASRGAGPAGPGALAGAGVDGLTALESLRVGHDGAGRAEVRLTGNDGLLGGVEVRLVATPAGVEATFLAEDAVARRGLSAPAAEVARALADRGVVVARVEVAVRADVGDRGAGAGGGGARGEAAPLAVGRRAAAGLPACSARSATDWVA